MAEVPELPEVPGVGAVEAGTEVVGDPADEERDAEFGAARGLVPQPATRAPPRSRDPSQVIGRVGTGAIMPRCSRPGDERVVRMP